MYESLKKKNVLNLSIDYCTFSAKTGGNTSDWGYCCTKDSLTYPHKLLSVTLLNLGDKKNLVSYLNL